jgi:hypothetical protein
MIVPSETECTRRFKLDGRIVSSNAERTLMQLVVALRAAHVNCVRSLTSHGTRGIRSAVGLTEHSVSGSRDMEIHIGHAVCRRRKGAA